MIRQRCEWPKDTAKTVTVYVVAIASILIQLSDRNYICVSY